jgi:hypothetical protein
MIQGGMEGWAMPSAVELQTDYSAEELRALARRSKDVNQSRRLASVPNTAAQMPAGDEYKAQILDREAQYGELGATQTGAQMKQRLGDTLSKLDAIKAVQHMSPAAPTGSEVRGSIEYQLAEQRADASKTSFSNRNWTTARRPIFAAQHQAR